jgi:hypothetical protein
MHIIRGKNGDIVAIASRLEDAIAIADSAKIDKTEYVVQVNVGVDQVDHH